MGEENSKVVNVDRDSRIYLVSCFWVIDEEIGLE